MFFFLVLFVVKPWCEHNGQTHPSSARLHCKSNGKTCSVWKIVLYMTPICSFTENFSKVQTKKRLQQHTVSILLNMIHMSVYTLMLGSGFSLQECVMFMSQIGSKFNHIKHTHRLFAIPYNINIAEWALVMWACLKGYHYCMLCGLS